ncbi:hypothetical protein YC2023_094606 [Brassica napus]
MIQPLCPTNLLQAGCSKPLNFNPPLGCSRILTLIFPLTTAIVETHRFFLLHESQFHRYQTEFQSDSGYQTGQ